jgi:head-tail adaptor
MRHRIVFQTAAEASDGTGAGGTITWSDTLTVWAEKWGVKSAERVEAARVRQNSLHRWHLRDNARIVSSMRIKWTHDGTTHYQRILAITPLGNHGREIEIIAEEKS